MINQKKWGIPFTFIFWALSVHFQFFLIYQLFFIIPIAIYTLRNKKIAFSKDTIWGFIVTFFILIPFIIAEIKFKFQGLKSFAGLFVQTELLRSFTDILSTFFDRLVYIFYLNVFSLNLVLAGVLTIFIIVYSASNIYKKREFKKEIIFLLFWLFSLFLIVPFEKAYAYFITIGGLYPAIILFAFIVVELIKKIKISKKVVYSIILIVLFAGQLNLILNQNKMGETLFSVQHKMILSDQLKVLDWIYKKSEGKPFAINTVTNPLFINSTWAYLFDWYGKDKFGYMPIWTGYPQTGQFGSDIKFEQTDNTTGLPFYLIIEPGPGIPEYYIPAISSFENTRSRLVEKIKIGAFIVEKKVMINNNSFDRDKVSEIIKISN